MHGCAVVVIFNINLFKFVFVLYFGIYFIDKTPPSISCPAQVTADAEPGESFRTLNFSQPKWSDNSIVGQEDILIAQSPLSITSPHRFPIGVTLITFTAQDPAKNVASCVFRVEIKGK